MTKGLVRERAPVKRICWPLVYAAAALFPLAALAAGAPKPRDHFTLTLHAPRQPLKAGKPLVLRVTIENPGDRPVHVATGGGTLYWVFVHDKRGRLAPLQPLPARPKPGGKVRIRVGSVHGFMLAPGESATDEVDVTNYYDLGQPGKYTIWIAEPTEQYAFFPRGFVVSNTITVTVVE